MQRERFGESCIVWRKLFPRPRSFRYACFPHETTLRSANEILKPRCSSFTVAGHRVDLARSRAMSEEFSKQLNKSRDGKEIGTSDSVWAKGKQKRSQGRGAMKNSSTIFTT